MFKIFKIFIILIITLIKPSFVVAEEEKIKVGLLVPMSGENLQLGKLLIKSTKLALGDINDNKIEIYPRDSGSNPNKTLQSATELKNLGVKRFFFLKICFEVTLSIANAEERTPE